ncbi:hypothetical protein AM231_15195 [Paenibacillus solani]|uniref:DUF3885 domain-containing protein n=2 Tax=Paenibacillus solani TaxID=1705565 RepID=A0A0M1P7E9_9BACL|nr:hypothetical protein AM231_15195 [Paenibacillus solani]
MHIKDYMKNHFNDLVLCPPLFYNWDTGIRFELGDPSIDWAEKDKYMRQVYIRALEIYKALHNNDDELYVVTMAHFSNVPKQKVKKLNLYKRYINNKTVLKRLNLDIIPNIFAEEDEEPIPKDNTYRYWVRCKACEVRHVQLIKSICNHEVGLKPRVYQRVYFINITTGTIFHIYDDRGCDVISILSNSIQNLFEKYNDWILDYDRERINAVFI